jgi:hypothetical protein
MNQRMELPVNLPDTAEIRGVAHPFPENSGQNASGEAGKGKTQEAVLIGINGSFRASHVCAEGEPHEHEWFVEARFLVSPRTDARCYRAAVDHLLNHWNGTLLPPELDWGEDLARAIGCLNCCVFVHVWRPEERIHAYWPAERFM